MASFSEAEYTALVAERDALITELNDSRTASAALATIFEDYARLYDEVHRDYRDLSAHAQSFINICRIQETELDRLRTENLTLRRDVSQCDRLPAQVDNANRLLRV
jgi:hypothetical protein